MDEVMDYRGLAAYMKYSQDTLRQKVMRKEIPYFKIGASVRFSKKHIDAWLEEHHREPEPRQVPVRKPKPAQELAGNGKDECIELFAEMPEVKND